MNNLDALYEMAEQVCGCNDCPDALRSIRFSWCDRLKRTIGNCRFVASEGLYEIHLSRRLFRLASFDDCVETVVHEVCHAIDCIKNGGEGGHGKGWRDCMKLCGYADASVGWSF